MPQKILIVEDDISFGQMLQKFFLKNGWKSEVCSTVTDARNKIATTNFDLILSDLRLPDGNGINLLVEIKSIYPKTAVIVMTGYAEVGTAVAAMKKGADDYISKPFTPDEILMVVNQSLKTSKNKIEKTGIDSTTKARSINQERVLTGIDEKSQKLQEHIQLVAPTNMSVLITGESGTGKEVTAKSIHKNSGRKNKKFVAVDCGAIPKELATSEFFGHVKGSFTGAVQDKVGHFEAANGGTLFLDEIGNLNYENQVQLLRAIQERKIKKVGSTNEIEIDVRIISATNENLLDAVQKHDFREDLYHRLNEFSIEIPPLSERFEDLMLFANYFLEKANSDLNKGIMGFSEEVITLFQKYNWPGNLRELKNVIKRSVLLSREDYIKPDVLPKEVVKNGGIESSDMFSKSKYEKDQIVKALKKTNFNKSKAAQLLQITRKTLYNKINHYNLDL
ncbi:sigma-54 dependent transcriptional regulator [Croceitalea sp. MTPC9]|uniref:sigma-54-dependent transcriptional regulator n=1 Tax=unclassified Croceitalea TaxID=2632280 RepID=UPI002B3CE950|nr:sigma-54 dependent transcriptional regulator [Croceitalea sp. MTPC6]GMN16902.1 sigma-54 dependent transcriptional regulator [Croceitalea sp. MTPC9]